MKIPFYVPRWVEEAARGVGVAVGTYLVMSITANGFPSTTQAVTALLAGAVPIAWAALRTALNSTPLTPPNAADTPVVLPKPQP